MREDEVNKCRPFCGACCIAPSITSSLPGMPDGKPAGIPCVHLDELMRCELFGSTERPRVCTDFLPTHAICGDNQKQALSTLHWLEMKSLP